MTTFTMMLMFTVLSFIIIPLVMSNLQKKTPHHTDMMAGDEGED